MDTETETVEDLATRLLKSPDLKCPHCRYSLQGLRSDRCPECGSALRLDVTVVSGDRCWTWWMAVLGCALALAIALCFGLALLGRVSELMQNPALPALVRSGMAPASDLPNWRAMVTITGCTIIGLAALAFLLAARGRWGTFLPRWQWALAAAGSMLPVGVLALAEWI